MFSFREEKQERGKSPWRHYLDYSLGIIIESAAVGAISVAALGIIYLVKILVK